MRTPATLIVGLVLLFTTAGCAGAPGSAARPTQTDRPGSASAETAAPAAPAEEPISAIVILADGVRFQAGAVARETIAYDAPADVALAAFADALGPESGSKEHAATNHTAPTTEHRFGEGVAVLEPHYAAGVENDPMIRPVWSVRADTAVIGEVRIGTEGGIAVGSPVEDIAGWNDTDRMGTLTTSTGTMAELLVVAAPGSQFVPSASSGAYGVLAIADPYPGPITILTAPSQRGGV